MSEVAESRNQSFTDVMIAVASLDEAENFWTGAMGLERVAEGEGWRMLEDPETKQRMVITSEPFGADWAIAFQSTDLESTLNTLSSAKAVIQRRGTSAVGFRYALAQIVGSPPILVYMEP